jgi:hypothetical protein
MADRDLPAVKHLHKNVDRGNRMVAELLIDAARPGVERDDRLSFGPLLFSTS